MARPPRKLLQQRKELVERFVRLSLRRWMSLKANALARRLTRPRLIWSDRKKLKALASALDTTAIETARARRLGFEANAVILNLGLFFLIAERDLQAVKIDALTHPDPWKRGLAARIVLLTIHELDIDKAAGNKLRQALDDGATPESLRQEMTEGMRLIRRAQSRAQKVFVDLRNSTIAHRDSDALRQLRQIVALDGLETMKIAAEFYAGTHKFLDTLPKLLIHMSSWDGMLSQLKSQTDRKQKRNNGG